MQLQKQTGFLAVSGLRGAPLNVCTLPDSSLYNATDLGPKTYVSYGRHDEVLHTNPAGGSSDSDLATGGGNPSTKIHIDMCDAINVCVHVQYGPGQGAEALQRAAQPAAVWDIFRREDLPALHDFIERHSAEFVHEGVPVGSPEGSLVVDPFAPPHPYFLDTGMLAKLKE